MVMTTYRLPEGMTAEDVSNVLRSAAEHYSQRDGEGYILTELADTIDPPKPEAIPDPDYRPPSIADGTIAPELMGGVRHLIDEYGPAGVQGVLEQLIDALNRPEPVVTDEMVDAVANEIIRPSFDDGYLSLRMIEGVLTAAIECGWTPPQELSQEGGPTASSSEAVAPGSQADGEAGVPQGPCPESESLSPPPPPSLAVGEKVDCMACGMSWTQCCEHRSKGLDNCCMACDEVGQRRNHTLQEGDGDDAELDALCTDIALEVVKRERDRWQKDCLVAEANEHRLAERLAMAEGLLRKAASLEDPPYLALGRHQMTTNEVAYLRSLTGEGDGDE